MALNVMWKNGAGKGVWVRGGVRGWGDRMVRASVPHKVSFEQKEVCGDSHGEGHSRQRALKI